MLGGNQLGGRGARQEKENHQRSVFRPYASIFGFPFRLGMPSRRIAEYSVEEFIPRSRAAPAWALDPPVSLRENGNNVLAFRFFKCRRGNNYRRLSAYRGITGRRY